MKKACLVLLALAWASWGANPIHVKSDQGYCNGSSRAGNIAASCSGGVSTKTFTFTPTNTNDSVLFFTTCATTANTPSAVTLSASGWVLTQVGSITGSASAGFGAAFRAYSPNTSAATFTVTWTVTGGRNSPFMNDLVDEFSGVDGTNFVDGNNSATGSGTPTVSVTPTGGNDMIWAAANDSVTAVGNIAGSAATKGADDTQEDWSEYRLISGGAGGAQICAFTGDGGGGPYVIFAVAIKAPASSLFPTRSYGMRQAVHRAAFWFWGFDVDIGFALTYRSARDYLRAYLASLPRCGALRWLDSTNGVVLLAELLGEVEVIILRELIYLS